MQEAALQRITEHVFYASKASVLCQKRCEIHLCNLRSRNGAIRFGLYRTAAYPRVEVRMLAHLPLWMSFLNRAQFLRNQRAIGYVGMQPGKQIEELISLVICSLRVHGRFRLCQQLSSDMLTATPVDHGQQCESFVLEAEVFDQMVRDNPHELFIKSLGRVPCHSTNSKTLKHQRVRLDPLPN